MEKIGIIDLGSNTARLVIVQVFDDGHFVVVDELKRSTRVGEGMQRDGFLKAVRAQETIATLKMYRRLCDASGVTRIIAVATAAVRSAKNQRSFLDEVFAQTGIKFKVLTAEEEAIYVYKGVINSMDVPKGLILEIGGGSTKLVYYNRRNLLNWETLPFGAITLKELFSGEGLTNEEQTAKVEEFFATQLAQIEWLKTVDPEVKLIGVGGSVRNLGRIVRMLRKYPLHQLHNLEVKGNQFDHTYNLIKGLELDKTKKIKGISSGRADVLPSAFAVIKAFKDYMSIDDMVISACGLREGIMFNYAVPTTVDKPISDCLGYSLDTLLRVHNQDIKHVSQVVNLSVQLFKQLRVLHKFPRQYLKILKVAATLHEIGKNVKYYNYQMHSWYMILNAQLYGISHRDIVLAAFAVALHKTEDVSKVEWDRYKDFVNDEDMDTVRKLGLMLRLADSFDRTRAGLVQNISCDILGDSVIMKTEVQGDATLEISDALDAGADFRKVFKKNLEIL